MNNNNKDYWVVPVNVAMSGTVKVDKADFPTLESAMKYVNDDPDRLLTVPDNLEYIDGSWGCPYDHKEPYHIDMLRGGLNNNEPDLIGEMNCEKILEEILEVARRDLNVDECMGYHMPDGKHHLFIYVDDSLGSDNKWYIVEPNKIVDGAHEPMGDIYEASYNNFDALKNACRMCIERYFWN